MPIEQSAEPYAKYFPLGLVDGVSYGDKHEQTNPPDVKTCDTFLANLSSFYHFPGSSVPSADETLLWFRL